MSPSVFSSEQNGTETEPARKEGDAAESEAALSVPSDHSDDQSEQPDPSETNISCEEDSEASSSSSSSCDGVSSTRDGQVSSSSNSPDLSTEGGADISDNAETALEPGEHD